jgi:hypothetical protein
MMKVGRGSCSSNSTIPTEPSIRRESFLSLPSGDAVLGIFDLSELRPLGALVVPGGLSPLNVPLASVTVFMPVSSPRVLLSILAATLELENRAGSCSLARRLFEKKRGDGGCPLSNPAIGKLKRSRVCRERV